MRQLRLVVPFLCLNLAAACSGDPTKSDEYRLLSEEASVLAEQLRDSDEKVSISEAELARLQSESQASGERSSQLQSEIATATSEIARLESQTAALNSELTGVSSDLSSTRAEVNAAKIAIEDFKENSSRYQSAVRQSIPNHQRYLCQNDWKQSLSLITNLDVNLLSSNIGSPSEFSTAEMRNVDPNFDDIDCGLWGEDTLFGSVRDVLNRVCERVNIDQLKKNPSSYKGQCFRGTSAYVTQFDTNTGPRTFHANLGSRYGDRAEFKLEGVTDDELYEGVRFDWWAIGNGSLTYQTTIGGTNSIPSFRLFYYWYYY